jgi:hypothetical protein
MNGAVNYFFLLDEVNVLEFMALKKRVEKLSREQAKQANKKG